MTAPAETATEALVQVAYGQHAADMILTVQPAPTGGAVVPPHWRAEAERRARPYTDALSAWLTQRRDDLVEVLARAAWQQRVDNGTLTLPWDLEGWELDVDARDAHRKLQADLRRLAEPHAAAVLAWLGGGAS